MIKSLINKIFNICEWKDEEIKILKDQVDNQRNQISELKYLEKFKDRICDYVCIDFNKINVFSIERENNITIIGFLINGDTAEWYLNNISVERHEILVKDFQSFLSSK